MNEFKFNCSNCGQHLAATDEMVGREIPCPTCQHSLVIPAPALPTPRLLPAKPAGGLRLAVARDTAPKPPPTIGVDWRAGSHCNRCGRSVPTGVVLCAGCRRAAHGAAVHSDDSTNGSGQLLAGLSYLGGIVAPAVVAMVTMSSLTAMTLQGHTSMLPTLFGSVFWISLLVPWLPALVIYLCDSRTFVRFHAAQAMVWFIGWTLINFAGGLLLSLGFRAMMSGANGHYAIPTAADFNLFQLVGTVLTLVRAGVFILTIIATVSAFVGRTCHLPVAGDVADSWTE